MIRRFMAYYIPHRKLLAVDLCSAFLRSGFIMVVPYLVYKLLGKEQLKQASLGEIWTMIAILSGLMFLMAISEFINIKWGHILGTRMETAMRGDLFRHLQKLSFHYFDNTKTGHIMSRISNDLFTIGELAHHGPEDFLISSTLILGSVVFMFIINWKMALIVAIPLPLLLIWGNIFKWRLRK